MASCFARPIIPKGVTALSDTALVFYLQKLCALCDNRKRCVQDLMGTANDAISRNRKDWRACCENALAIDMLAGLQSRVGTVLK